MLSCTKQVHELVTTILKRRLPLIKACQVSNLVLSSTLKSSKENLAFTPCRTMATPPQCLQRENGDACTTGEGRKYEKTVDDLGTGEQSWHVGKVISSVRNHFLFYSLFIKNTHTRKSLPPLFSVYHKHMLGNHSLSLQRLSQTLIWKITLSPFFWLMWLSQPSPFSHIYSCYAHDILLITVGISHMLAYYSPLLGENLLILKTASRHNKPGCMDT